MPFDKASAHSAAKAQMKAGEDFIKHMAKLADAEKQVRIEAQKLVKESGKWTENMQENNAAVEKMTKLLKAAREIKAKTVEATREHAKQLGKDFESLEANADDFGAVQFRQVKQNLLGVFESTRGVQTALSKLDGAIGYTQNKEAIASTRKDMAELQDVFDTVGISAEDFSKFAPEYARLGKEIDAAVAAGDDALASRLEEQLERITKAFPKVPFDNKQLLAYSNTFKNLGVQINILNNQFGTMQPTVNKLMAGAQGVNNYLLSLSNTEIIAIGLVVEGLKEVIDLQHKLQKELSFSNVGFSATLDYITQIQHAVSATGGLVDVEGASRALFDLQSHFRDFSAQGSHVIETSAQLTSAIGFSSHAFADLASQYRTLGIRDVDAGLKSAANTMAYFAKNTNLNTNEIQEMLQASKPLFEIYPDKLEKRLIPQLLGVAAAFKEIGLTGADAAKHLEEMADFSSPQGLLKAAFASQRGNISIDDILGGTKPGVAMAELGDSIHGLMEQFSGGDRRKFEFAARRVSELLGVSVSEARRFGNMNDEMRAKFRKRIDQEQDYAKQQTALSDALAEQMEGPKMAFKSLWTEVKTTLLTVGVAASRVLTPVFGAVSGIVRALSFVLKPINYLIEKVGTGWQMIWKALEFVWAPFELIFEKVGEGLSGLGTLLTDLFGSMGDSQATLASMTSSLSTWKNGLALAWDYTEGFIVNIGEAVVRFAGLLARTLDFRNFFANIHNAIPQWARKLLGMSKEDKKLVDTFGLLETADTFHEAADSIRKTAKEEYDRKEKDKVQVVKPVAPTTSGPESSYSEYLRTGDLAKWKSVEGTDKEVHTVPLKSITRTTSAGYNPKAETRAPTNYTAEPEEDEGSIYDDVVTVDHKPDATASPVSLQTKPEKVADVKQEKATEDTQSAKSKESSDERRRRQQEMDSRSARDQFMRRLEEASESRLLPPPYRELVAFNNFD